MSARIFTSSVLRSARPLARPPVLRLQRRSLFGFGSTPKPPTAKDEGLEIDQAELAKTSEQFKDIFRDKPEAVNAVRKFAKVMEESGVPISTGKMPGPMQLMKLAANPKFREAYAEVQSEFSKAGIDINSKEFTDSMMKIVKR
ncbi:hypothetical protein C8R43DRAFT_106823 [Mycena crocata]|nr:hypothetical protein C8R43DRAFT_106823 [Mycena crocata]